MIVARVSIQSFKPHGTELKSDHVKYDRLTPCTAAKMLPFELRPFA